MKIVKVMCRLIQECKMNRSLPSLKKKMKSWLDIWAHKTQPWQADKESLAGVCADNIIALWWRGAFKTTAWTKYTYNDHHKINNTMSFFFQCYVWMSLKQKCHDIQS